MAIPKIIHYCWFGDELIPQEQQKCINTWKIFFSDFEIKEWNEKNSALEECEFAKQAYDRKRYAFVSDYVRAKVLYKYGGIYLDTDIYWMKKMSTLLNYDGFLGFERKAFIGTAVMACTPHNSVIGDLLQYYEKHNFVDKHGNEDNIANVSILTDILKKKGLKTNGQPQIIDNMMVYNREVFFPKKLNTYKFEITEKTCAVHLAKNSWMTEREKKRGNSWFWRQVMRPLLRNIRHAGIRVFGKEKIRKLEISIRNKLR